eukprot:11213310-Lingulodinium_polyedra.AAC.1
MMRPRARFEPKWLRIVARRAGVCACATCAPTHRYRRYGLNGGNMHGLLCAMLVVCSSFVDPPKRLTNSHREFSCLAGGVPPACGFGSWVIGRDCEIETRMETCLVGNALFRSMRIDFALWAISHLLFVIGAAPNSVAACS